MNCVQLPKSFRAGFVLPMREVCLCFALLALSACGGGGGGGSGGNLVVGNSPVWTQNTYAASSTYAAQCAAPRTGTNPLTGAAYTDKQGSTLLENFWLRSWTHELYLWYNEVPDLNPASYSTTDAYFELLKTSATTSNGKAKDRFHFTYPTADWIALSQSGVSAGYGVEWSLISSTPPRQAVVAYTEPGMPAVTAGLTRGVKVLSVDGVDLVNNNTSAGVATLNAGMWPSNIGETHSFVVQELNGSQHTILMTSAKITSTPVQNVTVLSGNVGYMLFNDHIATAEQGLVNAFTQLQQANVADLILDLRYNGGGYLAIASEVAYMIAGSTRTSGKTFERMTFNDQYTTTNPVTGSAITPTPFYSSALGFSVTANTPLPTLNLSRVFVLTGSGTCSASESIINGLRGVGLEVIQIGSTTCGKPYGFYPQDNCGTTYFSIEFKGVNDQGFGEYTDGFSPSNTLSSPGVPLTGCSVADDYTHALGSSSEGRLAAALSYRNTSTCPVPASGVSDRAQIQSQTASDTSDLTAVDGIVPKGPWRENRIMDR